MDGAKYFDVDPIINRFLKPGVLSGHIKLAEEEIHAICELAQELFMSQPILLELVAPINICGDIHGQFGDLLKIFRNNGFPPQSNYLFLGDYVDRGDNSIETICFLLCYKLKYPNNFFLLRGNHECAKINKCYGFKDECKEKFNLQTWQKFTSCFNCLPVTALINDKIFCCHGGLSPKLKSMQNILDIERPSRVPSKGLLCDLLWSDPEENTRGWRKNSRGISFTFGEDVVKEFLEKNKFDLICRAHQVVDNGYEFFADGGLVTIFSAPNYCGEYDNSGAVMNVDKHLRCSFKTIT